MKPIPTPIYRGMFALAIIAAVVILLAGCGGENTATNKVQRAESAQQDQIRQEVLAEVGAPKTRRFAEARNLKRRYEELDDDKATGYIYLIDHGLVFAEYTVEGKVSSMNSQSTNPRQLTCRKIAKPGEDWRPCGDIDQSEPDGSYGENPEGIFFWTADGVYVEWSGTYLYSRKRLEIQQPSQNIIAKQAP